MRNISFALTTKQFLDGSKTVTRRLGWRDLRPGDRLMACKKCMGLGRGEKIVRLGVIEVVSVRVEPLSAITDADVVREGFPDLLRLEFVAMFMREMKCSADASVTRIEFKKL
jgi:hypothetical protein